MTRERQNLVTRLVALGILVSQALPFVNEKPYLLGVVATLLGLPYARKAQDIINRMNEEGEAQP